MDFENQPSTLTECRDDKKSKISFEYLLQLLSSTFWLVFGVLTGLLFDDPSLPIKLKLKKKVSQQNLDVLIIGAGISGLTVGKV